MQIMTSIKTRIVQNTYYQILEKKYRSFRKYSDYKREARRMLSLSVKADSVEEILHIQSTTKIFTSSQKNSEISALLNEVAKIRPKMVVEIGTQRGGTLFLFSCVAHPSATVISVDYQYPSTEYKKTLVKFGKPSQKVLCLQKNSHDPSTLQSVKSILEDRCIDFLFIDGDHSYEGVKRDYELYSPFVRRGGIIALHDIMPDYHTLYQQNTGTYTGGVPKYWQEIKQTQKDTLELIADTKQDGYGIGVVFVTAHRDCKT